MFGAFLFYSFLIRYYIHIAWNGLVYHVFGFSFKTYFSSGLPSFFFSFFILCVLVRYGPGVVSYPLLLFYPDRAPWI